MSRFWKREELERALQRHRPEPGPDFLRVLAARVGAESPRSRIASSRVALAAALTAALLAALGAFGGLGPAAAAFGGAVDAMADAVGAGGADPRPSSFQPTPAQAQYGVPICHRTGSAKNPYIFIVVDEHAVPAHERHPPKDGRRDIIPAPVAGCPTG
jgi:hypothetical protein